METEEFISGFCSVDYQNKCQKYELNEECV